MAQTVGELEADGLVKRRPDPYDRRRALVELTPAGRNTLADDRGRRVGWLVSAIDELPARDQAVLARATAIIGRLAERPD
jgi:DNA-binding MarR family transcriptional regulator